MKLITRKAAVRLVVLALIITVTLISLYLRMIRMPLKSYRGPLPSLTASEKVLSNNLRQNVTFLAEEIGERNVYQPGKLRAAADFIEKSFTKTGRPVQRQSYKVLKETCHNIEIEIPGHAQPAQIVVIGAHYDSVSGSPGANDNASGLAVLLALAGSLARSEVARSLRFVAFVNEEPPHFQSDLMGSRLYARLARERGEQIVAMVSLETMGYYSEAEGSQKYPFPLAAVYPSRGNFIAFVGNTAAARLVRRCIGAFRTHASFPSEGAALPGWLPGVGWSDHWSFWQEGYPAVMVTDTAPFRYPYYHRMEDTPDKLDYDRLARVAEGLEAVVLHLANSDQK